MDVTSSFPYSVHDEPTEDWTIEQLLQYTILNATYKTNQKRDCMVENLMQQFEKGKKEIMKLHLQAVELENDKVGAISSKSLSLEEGTTQQEEENTNPNVENETNDGCTTKEEEPVALPPPPSKPPTLPTTIHISITTGPYQGTHHTLQPKPRRPCFVGRSNGKKFRERGISLARDLEVSTTHGKFEMKAGGILFFTDTGSTNGTMYKGEELEDNVPLELECDMELLLGGSTFKIVLSD